MSASNDERAIAHAQLDTLLDSGELDASWTVGLVAVCLGRDRPDNGFDLATHTSVAGWLDLAPAVISAVSRSVRQSMEWTAIDRAREGRR